MVKHHVDEGCEAQRGTRKANSVKYERDEFGLKQTVPKQVNATPMVGDIPFCIEDDDPKPTTLPNTKVELATCNGKPETSRTTHDTCSMQCSPCISHVDRRSQCTYKGFCSMSQTMSHTIGFTVKQEMKKSPDRICVKLT